MEKMVWTKRLGACPRIESLLRKSHFGPFFCSFSLNMSNYSPQLTKEMDSKWLLPQGTFSWCCASIHLALATASILRQAPRLLVILIPLLLAACAGQPPAKVENDEVDARVRAPASEDSAGVQVYSLQNPAVKELTAQAVVAERAGELDKASGYLERALRIEPRDPQLLQQMAEIKLQTADYQQALSFAERSYDIGPRVGEICSRNWRTISVAREHLDDASGANDAEKRAKRCMNTRPKRY